MFGVMPTERGRGYAEYVAVPVDFIAHKPPGVSHEAAAVTTMAALTAWNPLGNEARIKPGETVLIHASSGGVGHFAIQIAKHFGAAVVATSSARNRDFVLSLGADKQVDYTSQNLAEEVSGVDFVLARRGARTRWLNLAESGALLALFGALPALASVGFYFAFWHGWRHIRRLLAWEGWTWRQFAWRALPNTLGALALATRDRLGGDGLVGVYLALIAALTVPHAVAVTALDIREGLWRAA